MMPTTRATPASAASGRSVASRRTSTGLPRDGASSCTPGDEAGVLSTAQIHEEALSAAHVEDPRQVGACSD